MAMANSNVQVAGFKISGNIGPFIEVIQSEKIKP